MKQQEILHTIAQMEATTDAASAKKVVPLETPQAVYPL
jgi:hypothetical protein